MIIFWRRITSERNNFLELSGKQKTRHVQGLVFLCAEGGNRTHTLSRERDFESRASANSATSAKQLEYNQTYLLGQGDILLKICLMNCLLTFYERGV